LKIDLVLYLEKNIDDQALECAGIYIPDRITSVFKNNALISNIHYSIPESYAGRLQKEINCHVRTGDDDVEFWKDLFVKTNAESLIKIFADSPFIDPSIINEMIKIHTENIAEYTFSENLPPGLTCDCISSEMISSIPAFDKKTLPLSTVVKSHINQFDVELYYKDPDIRNKRLSFRSSNLRDKKIMGNIHHSIGEIPSYSEIKNIIESNPEVLFIGPSYIEIELTGRANHTCIFSYRHSIAKEHPDMDVNLVKKIISGMQTFGCPYSVCLGGSGDPLLHPNFYEVLDIFANEFLIENIIVETDGLFPDSNYKQYLHKSINNRIKTIINMNGYDQETYALIHTVDSFKQVFDNVMSLKELNDQHEQIYLQIMKIRETEPFLDKYYDFWENYKIPIILQKQNTYLGKIKDRRYSDLSPLERTPCWHLQRDMYILSDGRVCFCKQDINAEYSRGCLTDELLQDIWEKGKGPFLNDYQKKYPACPDCLKCDEWYTFNF
jgi:spiro-SPASM protein